MRTLIIVVLFTVALFAQSYEILKEKYEGNGLTARVTIVVKYENAYYTGIGYGSYSYAKSMAKMRVEWKIMNTPSDSITTAQFKHFR